MMQNVLNIKFFNDVSYNIYKKIVDTNQDMMDLNNKLKTTNGIEIWRCDSVAEIAPLIIEGLIKIKQIISKKLFVRTTKKVLIC